jgi:hypothetical protein
MLSADQWAFLVIAGGAAAGSARRRGFPLAALNPSVPRHGGIPTVSASRCLSVHGRT